MSADSFHHQVEQSLKKMGKVYDFSDFVDCVRQANSRKNQVKVMAFSDFSVHTDFSSQHKLRKIEPRIYLKDIATVQAERGLFTLKYKTSHTDNEYKDLDFLQTKIVKSKEFSPATAKTQPIGIDEARKAAIIEKLVPLMPHNRRSYWLNLPTSTLL